MKITKLLLLTLTLSLSLSVFADEEENENHFPNEWFVAQRAFPNKQIDEKTRMLSFLSAKQFLYDGSALGGEWTSLGPTNIGGRVTDIQSSEKRPEVIFIGTANGGVFRSKDAGATFQSVFAEEASLSIGSIAVDPNNPDVVWVGTGEPNSSGSTYSGTGVYLSTDGGDTWTHKGLIESHHIARIVVDPHDSKTVFVAALGNLFLPSGERGVYKTTDQGTTWQLVHHVNDTAGAIDLALDPTNSQIVYTATWDRIHHPDKFISGGKGSGIYKSVDGGRNFSQLTEGLPASSESTGRIGIAMAASEPSTLYAIFDDTNSHFNGIYKTTNAGAHWDRVDSNVNGIYATYGWWFGNIRVSPTDPNRVFALGFFAASSSDGGKSWREIGGIHPDNHALFINPTDTSKVYLGCDGGFYTSTDGGSSFNQAMGLPITQFYSVAADSNRVFGGAQDNGTVASFNNEANWESVNGGDGFQVVIDPVDSNVVYSEYQNGALGVSNDGGHSFGGGGPNADRANWDTPLLLDPNNHKVLYYGANKLFRSEDQGQSWQEASPDLGGVSFIPDPLVMGTITAIGMSKADSNVIYAGLDNGKVWVTRDRGQNWTPIMAGLPTRWVTGFAVDPANAGRVTVSISGYRFGEPLSHVFQSEDFGKHWKSISKSLPEIPVNCVRLDPRNSSVLYAGTDAGIYTTLDNGATWQPLGSKIPLSPVMDLSIDAKTNRLYAATFGRGMFVLDISGIVKGR